jgi:hypothetical protein
MRSFKPFVAVFALFAFSGASIGLVVCRHFHVYSYRGWQVYRAMERECPDVWREYNFGRVRAGDDVEDVIRRTKPSTVERNGRWVELKYQGPGHFTGLSAAAYDGKMIFAGAWSCCWVRLFFDELSEEQSLEYLKSSKSDPRRFGIVPVYRS